MPKILTRLRVNEVSAVDRGAGEGVKILLMKRDEEEKAKREFSSKEREHLASTGSAMEDGSFPISNKSDLHNAMQAIGRAKNPAKAKAHIRARARALGLTSELSDAFKRGSPMNYFQKLFARQQPKLDVKKSVEALAEAVKSITDAGGDQQDARLLETFQQFQDHLEKSVTAGPAVDVGKSADSEGGDEMSPEILKALGLAPTAGNADVTKAIADMKQTVETAKAAEAEAKAKAKKPFPPKDEDEEESEEEKAEKLAKALEQLPAEKRQQLEEYDALKKQVQKLQRDADAVLFQKMANEVLVPQAKAEVFQKAYAGDRKALDDVIAMLKTANTALQQSDLLKEYGGVGVGVSGATAFDELTALAVEARKAEPKLTKEQAFAKVYADPANIQLVRRERAENAPR